MQGMWHSVVMFRSTLAFLSWGWLWSEAGCVYGVGYDWNNIGSKWCPQYRVLFAICSIVGIPIFTLDNTCTAHPPGVGDTNDMVDISEHDFKELVGDYRTGISEPKQRVIGEDSRYTHGACVKDTLMAQRTECL